MTFESITYNHDGGFDGLSFNDYYREIVLHGDMEEECAKTSKMYMKMAITYSTRSKLIGQYGSEVVAEAIRMSHWFLQFSDRIDIFFDVRDNGADRGLHGRECIRKGFPLLIEQYLWAEEQVTEKQLNISEEWSEA